MERLITNRRDNSGGCILVLYYNPIGQPIRPAIASHLRVLSNSSAGHQVLYLNVVEGVPFFIRHLHFDAVILHTTLLCARWAWFFEKIAAEIAWLRRAKVPIIALPQDEYDHSAVLDEWLEALNVQIIGSNFDESVRSLLYPRMRARAAFIKCLTGYVDPIQVAEFSGKTMPIRERPLDIVYRAAHLPYWFGSQGQLKHRIADIVARRAAERGLRTDISTEYGKTITSNQWFYFLASSKTIIGCESGSSVLDPRGEIQKRIRAMLAEAPELSFEDVSRRLPAGWDGHRFFAIGPRHLEAIITRTCQILVEGEYDGVLLPHRHYLPLRRDFGNLDEVLAMIKDDALLEATANRAYAEIIEGGKLSYVAFASQLDAVVPRKLHTRSQFAWFVICCLIEVTVRVRNWLAPPAARVALCTRGLIHTMKRGVKAGLRLLGVNFRRTPAPSAMSDAPGDESIRPAA